MKNHKYSREPYYLIESKQYADKKWDRLLSALYKHNFDWQDPEVIDAKYDCDRAHEFVHRDYVLYAEEGSTKWTGKSKSK